MQSKKNINNTSIHFNIDRYINRRTNAHKSKANDVEVLSNSSKARPIVVVNATFVVHVDKNNENLPPLECKSSETENKSPVKVPKIRKKKKCAS